MQWPDTNVGAAGAAGFEAGSVTQSARPGGLRGNPVQPVVIAQVPRRSDLPCTQDPELFFAEAPSDVEDAKALCQACPARVACFAGAVERREPWGVWGGELFLRGEVVPRKRPRGRPRKTEVAA
jgi:WhiB family transcriptional regulator, redox-sensing transcriptional regulator